MLISDLREIWIIQTNLAEAFEFNHELNFILFVSFYPLIENIWKMYLISLRWSLSSCFARAKERKQQYKLNWQISMFIRTRQLIDSITCSEVFNVWTKLINILWHVKKESKIFSTWIIFHYIVITWNIAYTRGNFNFIIQRIHRVNKSLLYALRVSSRKREILYFYDGKSSIHFMNFLRRACRCC